MSVQYLILSALSSSIYKNAISREQATSGICKEHCSLSEKFSRMGHCDAMLRSYYFSADMPCKWLNFPHVHHRAKCKGFSCNLDVIFCGDINMTLFEVGLIRKLMNKCFDIIRIIEQGIDLLCRKTPPEFLS